MILAFIGENTESWLIEYVKKNGLEDIAIIGVIIYVISLVFAAFGGWCFSGLTRVAELKRTLVATDKIQGEVTTQKEAILTSIRASRDVLSAADRLVTEELVELRDRIQKDHKKKADESREKIAELLIGPYWRALEDHCERIEYMLCGKLRHREIAKTLLPAVDSVCHKLTGLNDEAVMNKIGARSKLLLRPSTIHPIIQTLKTIAPWWKPWTWNRVSKTTKKFKPHLRPES